ncbi:expressed unknown protein [Seminavis robusta]|uniref:Uncharacterized protein n=1 Tax=Seminavis robusta TaxID=568900 RepID=A0A9N8DTP8_9STRA|nr:expressed unknown protein [Seminavis robusta]|eukprot:Sro335_g120170.1 n/a (293) ;mRNA; f:58030-59002
MASHDAVGAMHKKTTYTFDQPDNYHMIAAANANTRKHRRQHQRTHSDDPTDSGSLTYSAASSINSAGESTDSSFADIMKVLDMQDPNELGPLMKEKGLSHADYHRLQQQHAASLQGQAQAQIKAKSSQASTSSSLQYSTDGESNLLHGTDLVSTVTGQPSDSMANDGGSYNNESESAFDNITFAPADPTDSLKKRKKEKRQLKGRDGSSISAGSAGESSSNGKYTLEPKQSLSSMNTSRQSGGKSGSRQYHRKNNTPPPVPRVDTTVEEDICYAEWWMSCFPDAFREMMPRR